MQLLIRETPETALAGRNHRPKEVDKHLPTYEDPEGKSSDIAAKSVGWLGGMEGTIPRRKHLRLALKAGEKTRDIAANSVGWSGVAESIP